MTQPLRNRRGAATTPAAPTRRRARTSDIQPKPDTEAVSTVSKAIQELEINYRNISELHDYEFNPRDNEDAIDFVANSIRQFGFVNPIVIDVDDRIIIGHTRKAAALRLGYTRAPTIKVEHLTEDQVKAFRIIDNKVGEIARWNMELLAKEISEIGSAIDLIELGFAQEQIDCLSAMVMDDCLAVTTTIANQHELDATPNAPTSPSTAPDTTRWVMGELVITMPAEVHREWITALREECDFDQRNMINTIFSKLGVDHVAGN